MNRARLAALTVMVLGLSQGVPARAQTLDWTARCRFVLADDGKPESGKYFLQTRGKTAGAEARAEFDYSSGLSARGAVYPTDAKDLLNPYSTVSLGLGFFTAGDGKAKPTLGATSFRAIGKDFSAIPGSPVTMKIVIDGATFGPFQTAPDSSGMYSVWLDTAATDGDGKPPVLNPADFAKLAKAVEAMETVNVALVRDGADIVTATIPLTQLTAWRDGLADWAAKTSPGVGAATTCPGGGEVLN